MEAKHVNSYIGYTDNDRDVFVLQRVRLLRIVKSGKRFETFADF